MSAAATLALSPRRRRWLFALALTAGVLNLVDRQIIAVLKPMIAADLHWNDDDYGTLAAWFQAGAAMGFLAAGLIIDRLGVRRANIAGVATWSLAAMGHGWARTLGELTACRLALGATEAMGTPTGVKTITTLFPNQQRSSGFGLANAMNSLGAIVAPLAIPFGAVLWGWRGTFVAAGGAGLVWAAAWWLASRGVRFDDERAAVVMQDGEAEQHDTAGGGAALAFLRARPSWAVAGAKVLSDATWWLLLFWMPDYFHRQFGLAGTAVAVPLALAYGGAMAGSLLSGLGSSALIGRGWRPLRVRRWVMLASALGVLPVPLALLVHSPWSAVAIMALALAGHQGFSTSLFGLIADITPLPQVGRVTSLAALCGNLGGAVISKLSGWVLVAGLGYAPLFGFAAVSYLLALGWIGLWLHDRDALAPAPDRDPRQPRLTGG